MCRLSVLILISISIYASLVIALGSSNSRSYDISPGQSSSLSSSHASSVSSSSSELMSENKPDPITYLSAQRVLIQSPKNRVWLHVKNGNLISIKVFESERGLKIQIGTTKSDAFTCPEGLFKETSPPLRFIGEPDVYMMVKGIGEIEIRPVKIESIEHDVNIPYFAGATEEMKAELNERDHYNPVIVSGRW